MRLLHKARLVLTIPTHWLVERRYVQVSTFWIVCGSCLICAAAEDYASSTMMCATFMVMAVLCFTAGAVLLHLKASRPRASAAVSMCAWLALHLVKGGAFRLWAPEFVTSLGQFRVSAEIVQSAADAPLLSVFFCFRFIDSIAPVLCTSVGYSILAPEIAIVNPSSAGFDLYACAGLALAYLVQLMMSQLFRAEIQLTREKEAAGALINMMCDSGGIWLACDGDTVMSSDVRFDAIMGNTMAGAQLSQHVAGEDDLSKLKFAFKGTPTQDSSEPVMLLSVMLKSSQQMATIMVDIFIADRRRSPIMSHSDGTSDLQPGYLLGFRLKEPCAVEPPPQEHYDRDILQKAQSLRGSDSNADLSGSGGNAEASPAATLSSTMLPALREKMTTRICVNSLVRESLPHAHAYATVKRMIDLACDCAKGGVLIVVAGQDAFEEAFGEEAHEDGNNGKPVIRTSDGGYMTKRLRGIHVSHPDFAEAFMEFTEHSSTDRWPANHPHRDARGQPKDGAFLISFSGYRAKCAAKVLGLRPPVGWRGVGTKHEAALACAWAVRGSVVLVRSDSGALHGIWRQDGVVQVHKIISRPAPARGLDDAASAESGLGSSDGGDGSHSEGSEEDEGCMFLSLC